MKYSCIHLCLTVNDDKTEYLIDSQRNEIYRPGQHIDIGHSFRRVSQFKYLGSIVTQDIDVRTEVLSRVQENKGYMG